MLTLVFIYLHILLEFFSTLIIMKTKQTKRIDHVIIEFDL